MSENKQHFDAINGLRTYAILGIVLMHVLAGGKYGLNGFLFSRMIPSFSKFVYLFMTVSGFGMCCGYYQKFKNKTIDIVDFYRKRYIKILPFFAVLCFLDLAISPSVTSLFEVFANLTLCFGLLPNANISVIGVGWTLGVIFVFYLLFPFTVFLNSNRVKSALMLVISYIFSLLCVQYFFDENHVVQDFLPRASIVYCFVFFQLGCFIYMMREFILSHKWIKSVSFILLILFVLVYYKIGAKILCILLINLMFMLYSIADNRKSILNNKFTHFISGISFEIYLCHMVIYRVLEKIHVLHLFTNEYVNYILICMCTIGGAVVFSSCVKSIINRIMKKIKVVKE